MKGATRSPEFLTNVNSNGCAPVLQVGDRFLPKSNAAIWYLAEGTKLVRIDRWDHSTAAPAPTCCTTPKS